MSAVSLLPRLFADAGNRLSPTASGFKTGHEPVHASASGTCVSLDAEKAVWFCHSCNQGGGLVEAAMSLKGFSREEARTYLRDTAGEEVPDKKSKPSQADLLVALAAAAALWHTNDDEAWASFPVNDHIEHAAIKTKPFRRWLVGKYYAEHKRSVGTPAVQDALGLLEARACHEGPEYPIYVRVAETGGCIYLDLCDGPWQAVEISSTGWRVMANPPVHCKRLKGMLPLPMPVSGGSLDELRPFINVLDEDWILVKAWLLGAVSPQGPYPLLELHGEQGSAKSTLARLLRAIIDPSTVPLRRPPRDEKDLIVSSASSWIQVLDNLSHVPTWLSDALCSLATGGGIAGRELYSDSDVHLVDVMRPCILTGIEDLATRSDLLDRAIPISLAQIDDERRISEKRLWRQFETVRPRILGALLDAVSCALKNLPSTRLAKTPRMADFAERVVAASEKLGFTPEEFLDAYNTKRNELHASVIESNLVAQLIIRLVAEAPFKGTAQSLLVHLEILADDKEKKAKFFPTSARGVSNALRRISPNLRASGYSVEFEREAGTGQRLVKIERVGNVASQLSQTAKNKDFFDKIRDASCDDRAETRASVASHLETGELGKPIGCDAILPPVTVCDASYPTLSSRKNTSDNIDLHGKNESCDDCDATLPPYSNPVSVADFDWDTGTTLEVGVSQDSPDFEYITTATRLEAVMPDLLTASVIGLDTETTGLDPLKDRLRLIQIATPTQTVVIDADAVPLPLLAPLFDQPRQMIGHNLKFDLQFLIAAGLPWPTGDLFDTMLTAQLLGAGTDTGLLRNCGLAAVAQRCLGITVDKSEQKRDWTGVLSPEQLIYAAKDAAILLPLAESLTDALAKADLVRVAEIERRCLLATAWMELAGLPIDRDAWLARAAEETHRAQGLHAQLSALTGRPPLNGKVLHLSAEPPINWDSPAQVLKVFHERGHILDNTNSESLTALLGSDPLAGILLDYREAKKRAGTYGEAWLKKHLHPVTGRVHADYFQLGAASGRMSCTKPNVQNLPRNGSYRHAVCPGEGRAIVKADFSQIELRIAAVIARDENMLSAFQNGEDLHRLTASKVLGLPLDQVGKEHRQLAKALNFGLLYGMGAKALQAYAATTYKVTLSEAEATAHRQRFFQAYPGLALWHRATGAYLKNEEIMETRTMVNRRRLDITKYTVALNSPVQGTGADGLKLALARLYEHRAEVPDARVIATVHDELVAECPQDCAEQTVDWLTRHMTAAMTEILGESVPVEVETTCGRDWAGGGLAAHSETRGAA